MPVSPLSLAATAFTRLLSPTRMPSRAFSNTVTFRTSLRVLESSSMPNTKPVIEPFFTTVTSRGMPPSVIPAPKADGLSWMIEWPCRFIVMRLAATTRQSPPDACRSAVTL